jgi:hypothetical protein
MDGDCHVVAVCRKISPKSEKGRGRTKSLENVDRLWMPSKSLGSELADASPRIRLASYRGRLSFSFVQIIAFPSTNQSTHLRIRHLPHHIHKSIKSITMFRRVASTVPAQASRAMAAAVRPSIAPSFRAAAPALNNARRSYHEKDMSTHIPSLSLCRW